MTYEVLVENEHERSYTATLLSGPRLSVSGATREEALGKLRKTLERRLAKAEVVTIEVDAPQESNPWVRLAGVYKEHPLFDELLVEMEAARYATGRFALGPAISGSVPRSWRWVPSS